MNRNPNNMNYGVIMTHYALPSAMYFKQINFLLLKMTAMLFFIVMVSEMDVMLLFSWLDMEHLLSPLVLAFADAAALSCVASLPMYYWVVKPLKEAIYASQYRDNILSSAVQKAGDGIMISNWNGEIEYINQAFRDILKCDNIDVVGKPVSIIDPVMANMQWKRRFMQAIRQDQIWHDEHWGLRKNGEQYLAKVTVTPIVMDDGASISSFVTIVRDQTSHYDLQMQYNQSQKMEAIGGLVGGIAHDFNNMLSALACHLYIAKAQLSKESELNMAAREKLSERLSKMEMLSAHAAETIKQLMTFSRKGGVEKKVFLLSDFMVSALKLAEVSLPSKIDFKYSLNDEGLLVCANETQLQQAIMNLINNARDALSGIVYPQIRVDLKKVTGDHVGLLNEKAMGRAYVEIRVVDNGCGIESKNLLKIMEPFFTTKEEGEGTGLGLAMVYGIITEHGGYIDIKSKLGEGASIHLFLPIAEENAFVSKSQEMIYQGDGETILLVDDQNDVREGGREILIALGYKVLEARDGVEAFERYSENTGVIAAVLSDVMMPRMQGVELASRIKQDNPMLPVILVSGYDKDDVLDEEARTLVDQVLAKPFSVEVISSVLYRLLRGLHGR